MRAAVTATTAYIIAAPIHVTSTTQPTAVLPTSGISTDRPTTSAIAFEGDPFLFI